MKQAKSAKGRSHIVLETGISCARVIGVGRVMLVVKKPLSWEMLENRSPPPSLLLALDTKLRNVPPLAGIDTMTLNLSGTSPLERLELCLHVALKQEKIARGERLLCIYPIAFPFELDSLSIIQLKEKAEYVSLQKLDKLSEDIPPDVLSAVVDTAMELAREGREGKSIGSILVVGDSLCSPAIIN